MYTTGKCCCNTLISLLVPAMRSTQNSNVLYEYTHMNANAVMRLQDIKYSVCWSNGVSLVHTFLRKLGFLIGGVG